MVEVYAFFAVIFVVAVFYGVMFADELSDSEKEKKSYAAEYPFLGVFCWFTLMGITYWMLRMADKNILFTYVGVVECLAVVFLMFYITKRLRHRKK